MVASGPVASRSQTLVQLTDELRELLDRRAAELGVSRSKLIRDLLERGLASERRDDLSRRMIEGYRLTPQSEGRDAWGDLDAWTEANARRNLGALAREEEA
jgi:hypothetical protein